MAGLFPGEEHKVDPSLEQAELEAEVQAGRVSHSFLKEILEHRAHGLAKKWLSQWFNGYLKRGHKKFCVCGQGETVVTLGHLKTCEFAAKVFANTAAKHKLEVRDLQRILDRRLVLQ